MLTRIPPRRARIVGTKLGTRLSILRRSRGSSVCSEHSRDFLNTPDVDVAEPDESKIVQRSRMSGDSWVVPSPANDEEEEGRGGGKECGEGSGDEGVGELEEACGRGAAVGEAVLEPRVVVEENARANDEAGAINDSLESQET